MSKAREIYKILTNKKVQESKPVEVPNLDFHPELLRYCENNWVELVKDKEGEPFLIDGKRLYQIIDLENGLKQSRIIELNRLFEQSKDFGMTSENVDYNLKLMSSICQAITDTRNSPDEILALSKQMNNLIDGFKMAKQTKLGDDLIFAISALMFVFQDEDPSNFIEKDYRKRIQSFQKSELSFFFYTYSFKVLSALRKVFMTDTESFMKEVMQNSLNSLKRDQLILAESLHTDSISLSEAELDYLEAQMATTNVRMKCLESMALNFTIGSSPSEN